ncbi:MAG TPA: hypothetical protein VFQ95_01970 [Rhodanobacteraceae bacterium]|nr:hypothetical protein [Rhodanobacteraceae bacterium]
MFPTETISETKTHASGVAVCDRCGHRMREADYASGYDTLAPVRFRAGADSAFGAGRLVEGDFCDACLFELLGRYVRVTDDSDAPDTADLYQPITPRRLYAAYQLTGMLCDGVILTLREWIDRAFAPGLARTPLDPMPNAASATPDTTDGGVAHDRL